MLSEVFFCEKGKNMQIDANTALLLIDLQQGFDDWHHWGGQRNNPDAEQICFQLLQRWRQLNYPIFHIQHASTEQDSPLNPQHQGFAFKRLTQPLPHENVIRKQVNSAFIGTTLHTQLQQQGIQKLVIVGLTTHHCISTTARMAGNLGYETYVVEDATATFDRIGIDGEHYPAQLIHMTALASLHQEFAQVIRSKVLLS